MKKILFILLILISSYSFSSDVTAPNFVLQDQYKVEHSLEKYRGNKVIMFFWASWCGYCKEEANIIEKLYQENKNLENNFTILTFANEDEENIKKFLEDNKHTFPVINNSTIFQQYYIESFPTFYFLDENGKILNSGSGFLKEEEILKNLNNN